MYHTREKNKLLIPIIAIIMGLKISKSIIHTLCLSLLMYRTREKKKLLIPNNVIPYEKKIVTTPINT